MTPIFSKEALRLRVESIEEPVSFERIRALPCVILLAAAGQGKSTLLQSEFADLRAAGASGRFISLDHIASSADFDAAASPLPHELGTTLASWSVFLDDVDDCREPLDVWTRWLVEWVRKMAGLEIAPSDLRLRIATRQHEVATALRANLESIFPKGDLEIATIQNLSIEDIGAAIQGRVVDVDKFLRLVEEAGARALAERPATLQLLVDQYEATGRLPSDQRDLYRVAISSMLERAGLDVDNTMFAISELAAAMLLSNHLSIWTGRGQPPAGVVALRAEGLEAKLPMRELGTRLVEKLVACGLLVEVSVNQLVWFHRSAAEYLTALHLDLNKVQGSEALQLLQTTVLGERAIRPQLRETAAWLSIFREDFRDLLISAEPEVLLYSDVALLLPSDRSALAEALLRNASVPFWMRAGTESLRYERLKHAALGAQLGKELRRDSARSPQARELAIEIARACDANELAPELLQLALDSDEDTQLRVKAARFVADFGSSRERSSLRALVATTEPEDPNDELRGVALSALWPSAISPEALFAALTPVRNKSLIGSYSYFLYTLKLPRLTPASALSAAEWLLSSPAEYFDTRLENIASQALLRIWQSSDDDAVLASFARVVAAQLQNFAHPLRDLDVSELQKSLDASPQTRRQKLLYALIEALPAETSRAQKILYWSRLAVVSPADLRWFLEELVASREESAPFQTLLEIVVNLASRVEDIRNVGFVWDAASTVPGLASALQQATTLLFDSEGVRLLRDQASRRRKREADGPYLTTVPERFDDLATSYSKGQEHAWWQINLLLLSNEQGHPDELHGRLDTGPAWGTLGEQRREAAFRIAASYLKKLDLRDDWLRPNVHHRPAAAAYRALRLLWEYRRSELEFEVITWESLVLPILAFGANDPPTEREVQGLLLHRACEHIGSRALEIIQEYLSLIGGGGLRDVAGLVHDWATPDLLHVLWQHWSTIFAGREPGGQGGIETVRLFAEKRYEPLLRLFSAELRDAYEGDLPSTGFLDIAEAMFDSAPENAADWLLHLVRSRPDFAVPVVARVTRGFGAQVARFVAALKPADSVSLYSFAREHFPQPASQEGAYWVTPLHEVDQLRQRIVAQLVEQGSEEAARALTVLRDQHRDQPWLQYYVDQGSRRAREHRPDWPEPMDVLQVLKRSATSASSAEAGALLVVKQIANVQEDVLTPPNPIEAPSATGEPTRKRTFLFFASEWLSGHGGISTVNREMATSLAVLGHSVYCFIPTATPEDIKLAASVGVQVLSVEGVFGLSESQKLAFGPAIPKDVVVDYVVGHEHVTGPAAAAWAARYGASYIHVVHTSPDEIATARIHGTDDNIFVKADQKRQLQLSLCLVAKLIVAIGPMLFDYVSTTVHGDVPVYNLIPGLHGPFAVMTPQVKYLREEHCLFVGRGDDLRVKGLDLLAGAMERLRKRAVAGGKKCPQMTFRGLANPEEVRNLFPNPQGIRFHGFSSDPRHVAQDLRTASVLVMPSRAEGFGLVALEAISAGVPTLVSDQSGIAKLMQRMSDEGQIPKSLQDSIVVRMTGDDDGDANAWSLRIEEVMSDRDAAFEKAHQLRELLRPILTWGVALERLVAELESHRH